MHATVTNKKVGNLKTDSVTTLSVPGPIEAFVVANDVVAYM